MRVICYARNGRRKTVLHDCISFSTPEDHHTHDYIPLDVEEWEDMRVKFPHYFRLYTEASDDYGLHRSPPAWAILVNLPYARHSICYTEERIA